MSITPTAIRSASPRPYAGSSVSLPTASFTGSWVCSDHMSNQTSNDHRPTTVGTDGSKRLAPGSSAGVLT